MAQVVRGSEKFIADPYLASVAQRFPSHKFLGGATGLVYDQQVAAIARLAGGPPSDVRVLDWGCGKGQNSYLLRAAGFNVTSCDVAASTHDSTFGQATPILEEQSIEVVPLLDPVALPFDDKSFDVVTSFGVLEHVQRDGHSLGEIRRILRPGGLFFCSFLPYRWSWTQRLARITGDGYHDRLYTRRIVRGLFADAHLAVESIAHGQLFPKNVLPRSEALERVDQALCRTPLKHLATNLIIVGKRSES
jgi:SAM-dependent methyltransferase